MTLFQEQYEMDVDDEGGTSDLSISVVNPENNKNNIYNWWNRSDSSHAH